MSAAATAASCLPRGFVPCDTPRASMSASAVLDAARYRHDKLTVQPRRRLIEQALTRWTHAEGARTGRDWIGLNWRFDAAKGKP